MEVIKWREAKNYPSEPTFYKWMSRKEPPSEFRALKISDFFTDEKCIRHNNEPYYYAEQLSEMLSSELVRGKKNFSIVKAHKAFTKKELDARGWTGGQPKISYVRRHGNGYDGYYCVYNSSDIFAVMDGCPSATTNLIGKILKLYNWLQSERPSDVQVYGRFAFLFEAARNEINYFQLIAAEAKMRKPAEQHEENDILRTFGFSNLSEVSIESLISFLSEPFTVLLNRFNNISESDQFYMLVDLEAHCKKLKFRCSNFEVSFFYLLDDFISQARSASSEEHQSFALSVNRVQTLRCVQTAILGSNTFRKPTQNTDTGICEYTPFELFIKQLSAGVEVDLQMPKLILRDFFNSIPTIFGFGQDECYPMWEIQHLFCTDERGVEFRFDTIFDKFKKVKDINLALGGDYNYTTRPRIFREMLDSQAIFNLFKFNPTPITRAIDKVLQMHAWTNRFIENHIHDENGFQACVTAITRFKVFLATAKYIIHLKKYEDPHQEMFAWGMCANTLNKGLHFRGSSMCDTYNMEDLNSYEFLVSNYNKNEAANQFLVDWRRDSLGTLNNIKIFPAPNEAIKAQFEVVSEPQHIDVFNNCPVAILDGVELYRAKDVFVNATNSKNPSSYWYSIKRRLKKAGSPLLLRMQRAKFADKIGRMRFADCFTEEDIMELLLWVKPKMRKPALKLKPAKEAPIVIESPNDPKKRVVDAEFTVEPSLELA